jgi:DNA-directed RNA polymerase subunit F
MRAVAAVLLLASLLACNDKALQTTGAAPAEGKHVSGTTISPEQASKVLAKVGDKTITLGDFIAALEHMDQFDRLRYQSPERRKELLREMIDIQLLADEAEAKGYDKDPLTQQEIRSILRSAMMEQAHAGAPMPASFSAADIQAYYDAHKDQYRDPERRKVSVMVLPDDAHVAETLDAAKKAPSAAKWGELVRAKSIDPAAKANTPIDLVGDYGWVTAPGDPNSENTKAPEEVRAVAFQIASKGQVYDKPVKVAGDPRVFVVRLTDITPAHERTVAEADRAIRVKLVQDKVREREEDLLNRLRAEYPVQIDDAVLATVHVDLPNAPHQVFADAGAAPPPGSPPGPPPHAGPGAHSGPPAHPGPAAPPAGAGPAH